MTYPTGAGSAINNCGPYTPAGAAQGASTPFVAPAAPPAVLDSPGFASLTPVNFTNSWNFVNSKLAMQVDADSIEGPQQGTPYITNASAVNLAGYSVGQLSFVKVQ